MPTNNYFNPNSFNPSSGGMMLPNGYDYQMDRQRLDEMAGLQKTMIGYELAKEHEDLTQGYGVRSAERREKESKADLNTLFNRDPRVTQARMGGEIGKNNSLEATGRYDLGTVDSRMGKTNSENKAITLESEARRLELMASGGNLAVEPEYQRFLENVPQEFKGAFPKTYNQSVPEILRKINSIVDQNAEFRRKSSLQGQAESATMATEVLRQEGATARTNMQAQAQVGSAEARIGAAPENRDRAIARLQRELRVNPNDPNVKRELTYYLNKDFVDDFAKDIRAGMLGIQSRNDPKAAAELEEYQNWSRARYFDQHGVENPAGKLSFAEFRWLSAAMKANHGISMEQAIQKGQELGRIKSRTR